MFTRIVDLPGMVADASFFLFGPRQTGKTTLLRSTFPEAPYYNLLEADTFRDLTSRPELIRKSLTGRETLILIDEVQRHPPLLDEVQVMLDANPALRFILTGSSARALRRRGVNLLGGRARVASLYPLVAPEVGFERLDDRLSIGSLPAVLNSRQPHEALKSYVGTYLQEEVRAEGLVRSLDGFSRFLEVAALMNGNIVNFTKAGSDAGVPPRTIREHYRILEDTLLGTLVPPFQGTLKRKPVATSKFYFFDVGIANHLMNRDRVRPGSPEYGSAIEHLVFCELRAWLGYRRLDLPLTFWRSQSRIEVDFVVGQHLAVEVKAADRVQERDLKPMRLLSEEATIRHRVLVSGGGRSWKSDDGIEILPIDEFLRRLWGDAFRP